MLSGTQHEGIIPGSGDILPRDLAVAFAPEHVSGKHLLTITSPTDIQELVSTPWFIPIVQGRRHAIIAVEDFLPQIVEASLVMPHKDFQQSLYVFLHGISSEIRTKGQFVTTVEQVPLERREKYLALARNQIDTQAIENAQSALFFMYALHHKGILELPPLGVMQNPVVSQEDLSTSEKLTELIISLSTSASKVLTFAGKDKIQ